MNFAFGQNEIDQYSVPLFQRKTKLATIFKLNPRDSKEKPGRILEVIWDERKPLVGGFNNRYSYVVIFKKSQAVAGNHYHKIKQELFTPLVGKFSLFLEDTKTKKKEKILMDSDVHETIYIKVGIAHAVRAETKGAILHVAATSPGVEADEIAYRLT